MRKVERQIYFYEVELQKYSKENNSYYCSNNFVQDLKDLFEKFEDIPFDKENLKHSMYLEKNNGT